MKNMKHFAFCCVLLVGMWGLGTLFARTVSDYVVITPKLGVSCIVVSRMFNTSVDCWKEEPNNETK